MGRRKLLVGLAAFTGLVVVGLIGAYLWASSAVASASSRTFEIHTVDFPVPFPLTEDELQRLRTERQASQSPDAQNPEPPADPLADVDLDAEALQRAVERGRHLVNARYACVECHGNNFAGGVMIDDPAIGTLKGPNLTAGRGGKVANYTSADWDRSVRHGVLPNGRPSIMPAEDYQRMSDQELSDIIAYIRTFPPVDNEVPHYTLGPVGLLLMAAGELEFSVDKIQTHAEPHALTPPEAQATAEFGKHLAGVCTGCHREDMQGGPIPGGPPDWAPAANLTPHDAGLKGWTYEQFASTMRTGTRPNGQALKLPMSLMLPYAQKMTDVELQALWAYLQSMSARPTGT